MSPSPPRSPTHSLQLLLKGPVFSRTHVDFLFKALMHLLQLQFVLPAQLVLVPVLFLLEQPELSEFLAPEGVKEVGIRKWPRRFCNSQLGTLKAGVRSSIALTGLGQRRGQNSGLR